MQEEADAVGHAARAQQRGQRHQVIVVDPDLVVGADFAGDELGETLVDLQITLQVRAIEGHQVGASVQQRPQRAIGVFRIEIVEFAARQIPGQIADAAELARLRRRRIGNLSAPAQPAAAALLQQREHGLGKAAGLRRTGQHHAIGYDDQASAIHRGFALRRVQRTLVGIVDRHIHPPSSCRN